MKFALALMVSTAILLAPQLATACAVCFTGRTDETRLAFLVTTGFLTALPILLVGTLVWWLCRRARQIRDEHESASPAVD
jgi:ABC-type tungstate transport system substrate-binding protein